MSSIYTAYKDKIIVVAGGASGIGEHIVRQLSVFAKTVIIMDRNKKAGTTIVKDLADEVFVEQVEMKDTKDVQKVLKRINSKYGTIDYFFNTAGTFLAGEIRDTPVEDWHLIAERNLQPIINGTATVYEIMRDNGHGHIINVASAAGLFIVPAMSVYGATKAAVVSLSLGLRLEAKTLNIKVSVVCPTVVETPLYETAMYDGIDKEKALDYLKKSKAQQPQKAARRIIEATAKNKAIIHTAHSTLFAWALYRFSPTLYIATARRFVTLYRKSLRSHY
ncbi:MAG: oxidoreductase [Candidatus Saccharibacteria bacterium]|nr:oxidoreductase [Candidatus Saccharibacteria bacterium]